MLAAGLAMQEIVNFHGLQRVGNPDVDFRAFGLANRPAHTAVQSREHGVRPVREVHLMLGARRAGWPAFHIHASYLQFPAPPPAKLQRLAEYPFARCAVPAQQPAFIGKRQRYSPPPGQRTIDFHQRQQGLRPIRFQNAKMVGDMSVRGMQHTRPTRAVEEGRVRMECNALVPGIILDRIELSNLILRGMHGADSLFAVLLRSPGVLAGNLKAG